MKQTKNTKNNYCQANDKRAFHTLIIWFQHEFYVLT